MNINQHKVKLLNASGKPREIGEIPDLWYLQHHPRLSIKDKELIIDVWHMTHNLKDAITNLGQARVIDVSRDGS